MLLAKLDITNKLVLIFQEGMNKKNKKNIEKTKKNEVKKTSAKKLFFYITMCICKSTFYAVIYSTLMLLFVTV